MVDYQKIEISNRVKELKEMAMVVPSIKADRDVLVKEAYIDNEAEPIIVKRAKTLEIILDNIPINIGEDELIVGNLIGGKPRAVGLYLELSKAWKEKELDRFSVRKADRFEIDEGAKKILEDYTHGKPAQVSNMAKHPVVEEIELKDEEIDKPSLKKDLEEIKSILELLVSKL